MIGPAAQGLTATLSDGGSVRDRADPEPVGKAVDIVAPASHRQAAVEMTVDLGRGPCPDPALTSFVEVGFDECRKQNSSVSHRFLFGL